MCVSYANRASQSTMRIWNLIEVSYTNGIRGQVKNLTMGVGESESRATSA